MTSEPGSAQKRAAASKLDFPQMLKELFGLGCIGFGGGSALIPVFKERLVDTGKVREEELESAVAVACITPGALPVELAGGIGLKARGALGALAAAAAFAAPGVLLTLAALLVLSYGGEGELEQVAFLAVGVSGYILSVIARYVAGSARRATTSRSRAISIALIAVVFALTCGKSLISLIGASDIKPLFSLGTVDVMALFFFGAAWIGPKRTMHRVASGLGAITVYCLLKSSLASPWQPAGALSAVLAGAMFVMAIASLMKEYAARKGMGRTDAQPSGLFKTLGCFALALVASGIVAALACGDGTAYIANAALSSILSFGGGDAYIAMADGLFVGNDIVTQEDFYGLIVPVSNALPGSILCKVLTGCGFAAAFDVTSSIASALCLAAAGFVAAIAMSCATFALGSYLLDTLKESTAFELIGRYIGCVVSGLLLTVSLGFLHTCAASVPEGLSLPAAIALPLFIAVCNFYVKQRFNTPAPAAVIVSAVASAIILNLL